ncbi:peptidase S8 [Bacillus sp. FJAT-42376]|uniref:S8 family serine peptidase n=1 Tax=Bacillus sp. FJAT-42376 TaxID=2014076 RepID=UPI000F5169D1|nr:S8 family serine peptidase [Bacillus sp. FJAT-42376]AZB40907.1 peptidase S8 [Bacillus sp. FJAT-42376]
MKKIMILLVILCFQTVSSASSGSYSYPERPPLPAEDTARHEKRILMITPGKGNAFKTKLRTQFPAVKIRHQYNAVFEGFSVEGSVRDLHTVLALPEVEDLGPVTVYQAEAEDHVSFVGGDKVRGIYDQKNQRLTGKGIKVGVIDTGMDYLHPDLRRNYAGGYDLVDDDRDPMETRGNKELATLHGTHVAGIIAANGRVKGIAPEASLYIYRALGPGGMGTSEWIIAAIDRAVRDKVDVLNLSLGNDVNGPDWPTSLALNRAVDKGIIAVAAGGNSGPEKWTLGSPGTAEKAISVGASTPPMKGFILKIAGIQEPIRLNAFQGAAEWKPFRGLEIADAGFGRDSEFPKDTKGKLVIAQRGKISFSEKAEAAERKGAAAILVYNNEKGNYSGSMKNIRIPAASLSRQDGIKLRRLLQQRVDIEQIKEEDTLAGFSSRGPVTGSWAIKPDIVAPGVAIMSTIPDKQYKALQGTSMAAPLVAGAAALVKQAHPDWTPEEIKAVLMNTAIPIKDPHSRLYEPIGQGAGRMDVYKAVRTEVLAVPGSLVFSQFSSGQRRTVQKATIRLVNHSAETEKFSFDYPVRAQGITWKIPAPQYVPPHSSKTAEIILEGTPMHLTDGTHQGWVAVRAGKERFSLPYLYMMNEPDYPRLMGFSYHPGEEPGTSQYEVYLPGGADEIGIALYEPASYHFIGYLDWKKNVGRGRLKRVLINKDLNMPEGTYKAVVFAKKGKVEDVIETSITIDFSSQR